MGRGSDRLDGEVRRLRAHGEELRSAIDRDTLELERRLRDALDVRRQARRHAVVATVAAAGAGFALGVFAPSRWSLLTLRRRRRPRET